MTASLLWRWRHLVTGELLGEYALASANGDARGAWVAVSESATWTVQPPWRAHAEPFPED